jgi:hypothetical protein
MRRTRSTDDLRTIARYQKVLILCLLGQLFLWIGVIFLKIAPLADGDGGVIFDLDVLQIAMVLTGVLGLVAAVFVLLLGMKVSGTALGVFLGILTIVPCLGLIMILIVNVMSTTTLQTNGVRVGLLGARMRDIDNLSDEPNEEEEDEERPRRRRRQRRRDEINEDEGW